MQQIIKRNKTELKNNILRAKMSFILKKLQMYKINRGKNMISRAISLQSKSTCTWEEKQNSNHWTAI